jgi:GH25 family lysozyme M1 (1,4-beta-N-acetylmuramidase)
MRLPVRPRRAGLVATSGVAALLALSAATVGARAGLLPFTPWSAAVNAATATGAGSSGSSSPHAVNHFNVGAAHSPQLLHQLAASGTMSATGPASIAGAVQGVDVSSIQEQHGIDWSQVAGSGKQFAAIKVTEGDYYENKYALSDLAAAKAAGLAVMAYAFAIPNGGGSSAGPVTQADDAINYVKSGSAGVPPIMLDIEYDPYYGTDGTNQCYGLSQSAMGTWVKSFAAEVQAKTGQPAIIYTTKNWWNTCVGTTASLGSNPLWVAIYNNKTSPGTLPDGWSKWKYWQYGQNSVPGISGTSTDVDQLNPNVLTLIDPGDQQAAPGSAITPLQLHASQNVTYNPADLPSGLSLSSTGQITGTAGPTPGTVPVTVTATNTSTNAQRSVTFNWYWTGTLSVTPPANQTTVEGSPVDFVITATDSPAAPPVTFSAPVLPPGLRMTPGGRILGWPDKPGSSQVTVYAADAFESAGTATFTWTVSTASGSGQTGHVQLGFGGKCLDDPGDSATAGTAVDIRSCGSVAAERWTYAQDESLRINGMCLQAPTTADSTVLIESCMGGATQQWRLAYARSLNPLASTDALALYNPGSGMCLDDPAASTTNGTTNGTKQVIWPCDGNDHQEWTLPSGPIQSGIPGKCVDDSQNLTTNGNKIDIASCVTGSAAQQWRVNTDGTVQIHGKCLNIRGGKTARGTRVNLYSCNGTGAQQWRQVVSGSGVLLQNPHSGLCLADPGSSTVNGTQLQILSCTGTNPGRLWRTS